MSMSEIFIKKVEAATKARSKEIRITLEQAQILVMEISGTIARENDLLTKIVLLQDVIVKNVEVVQDAVKPVMDGGSFKDDF